MSELSEHTPSQAEGDRDDDEWTIPEIPHSTPSQAEGERDPSDAPTAPDEAAGQRLRRADGEPRGASGGAGGTRTHGRRIMSPETDVPEADA